MKAATKLLKNVNKNMLSYLVVLFVFLFLLVFRKPLFILLMILVGGFSTIHKKVIGMTFGFELITFFSVLITIANGLLVGLISMIIMVVLSHIITARICVTMFIKIGVYFLILFLASLLSGVGIAVLGIGLSIFLYVILFFLYVFVFGYNPLYSLMSAIGAIVFNYIFFSRLGEIVLNVLV
jgi:hypothetical protein